MPNDKSLREMVNEQLLGAAHKLKTELKQEIDPRADELVEKLSDQITEPIAEHIAQQVTLATNADKQYSYQIDEVRLARDYTSHEAKGDQPYRYESIRTAARQCARVVMGFSPKSREQELALVHLEQATFYAIAAIARNEMDSEPLADEITRLDTMSKQRGLLLDVEAAKRLTSEADSSRRTPQRGPQ